MPLTLTQMLALIPDNTSGDVTPADMRDVVTAIVRELRAPYSVDDADDVWWDGDIGDFTTLTITGNEAVTEGAGRLSVTFNDQSANDLNCVLKAHTFAVGDSFVVPISMFGSVENYSIAGLVFADGTTSAANAVATCLERPEDPDTLFVRTGTLTAMTTLGTAATFAWADDLVHGPLYLRLTYQAANTWRPAWSIDGFSWLSLNESDVTFTLTPTHFGVCWSAWGATTDNFRQVSFGPISKLA